MSNSAVFSTAQRVEFSLDVMSRHSDLGQGAVLSRLQRGPVSKPARPNLGVERSMPATYSVRWEVASLERVRLLEAHYREHQSGKPFEFVAPGAAFPQPVLAVYLEGPRITWLSPRFARVEVRLAESFVSQA